MATKQKSRIARWEEAASKAAEALRELRSVQEEYEDWQSKLPDNLQSGILADKLDEVVNLDIEGALDTAEEAECVDLPQGFGRD